MFGCLYRAVRCLCFWPARADPVPLAPVVFSSHEEADHIPWGNVRHKFDVVKHLSDPGAPVVSPDVALAHNNFILTWINRFNQDRPPLSPVSGSDLNTSV
jgi:hypothetical protein